MNRTLSILSRWRPDPVETEHSPQGLVAKYESLIHFLWSLPPEAKAGQILRAGGKVEVEVVRCVRCLNAVGEDRYCSWCRRFLWGDGAETLRWSEVPSTEGLLNPASAYPVPPEHAEDPRTLAIWLATHDEMARLEWGLLD